MCTACLQPLSRRTLLKGAGATAGALSLGLAPTPAWAAGPDPALLTTTPAILPRSAWAGTDLPVRGPLPVEAPGDVRFLLVHHTFLPGNDYGPGDVVGLLRGTYAFHTGPEKRWPDIAYNFLVDRYGRIWEGRAGSLTSPVVPGATGGTQGYDQLGCFLGDHSTVPPTPQAQASMISLLAWLARRYAVDTRPGTTVSFVSRGSNRWPAGTRVTTRTIEGHRAMSLTTCPGDAAYPLVRDLFPSAVTALNAGPGAAIDTKYTELGGAAGLLGAPLGPEVDAPGGRVRHFAGGDVYWSPATGAHEVHGALLERYRALGTSASPLGLPTSDELGVSPGGRGNTMQGGLLLWSSLTGAHAVHGAIAAKYAALGGPAGALGLPLTDELDVPGGRCSRFAGGDVYWSEATGAHEVHGAIRARYDAVDGPRLLGLPVGDEVAELHGRRSDFARGRVLFSPATGAWPVLGAVLARYLAGGGAAAYGFPMTGEVPSPGVLTQVFERAVFVYDLATGTTRVTAR